MAPNKICHLQKIFSKSIGGCSLLASSHHAPCHLPTVIRTPMSIAMSTTLAHAQDFIALLSCCSPFQLQSTSCARVPLLFVCSLLFDNVVCCVLGLLVHPPYRQVVLLLVQIKIRISKCMAAHSQTPTRVCFSLVKLPNRSNQACVPTTTWRLV